MIEFFVPGKAAPQGSKRHVGRGILIESSKEVGPWRERVALMAHATKGAYGIAVGDGIIPRTQPLEVSITFYLPRPASLAKKIVAMVKRPDIDKLGRAILDALTDVIFEDDSQVVDLFLRKRYASDSQSAGAQISIRDLAALEIAGLQPVL